MLLRLRILLCVVPIVLSMLQLGGFRLVLSYPHSMKSIRTRAFSKAGLEGTMKPMPTARKSNSTIAVKYKPKPGIPFIKLTDSERKLFDSLKQGAKSMKPSPTLRVAGGWVRDRLLGVPSRADIDFLIEGMTGSKFAFQWEKMVEQQSNEKLKFHWIKRSVEKSKHLETVSTTYMGYDLDFVNMRSEEYSDPNSRIPVMRMGTPLEDASRRDLTINALFYNLRTGLVEDFTGKGLPDLRDGIIRTPLAPLDTLLDDPLRGLRLVRFAGQLDFSIDPDAIVACTDNRVHAALREKVSKERVLLELVKILGESEQKAVRSAALLYHTGYLSAAVHLPTPPQQLHNTHKTSKSNKNDMTQFYDNGIGKIAKFVSYEDSKICANPLSKIEHTQYAEDFFGKGINSLHAMAFLNAMDFSKSKETYPYAQHLLQICSSRTGDDFKDLALFRLATLLCASGGYLYPAKHKYNYLVQHITDELLKCSKKDTNKIMSIIETSLEFKQQLNACVDHCRKAGSSLTQSQSRSNSSPSERLVPISFGPLSRSSLGLIVCNAGAHWAHAIQLAANQIMCERVAEALPAHVIDTPSSLHRLLFSEFCALNDVHTDGSIPRAVAEARARESVSSTAAAAFRALAKTKRPQVSTSTVQGASVGNVGESPHQNIFNEVRLDVIRGMDMLLHGIDQMQLQNDRIANLVPFNGHSLAKEFPSADPVVMFRQMKLEQQMWKLGNPSGSDEELLVHLRNTYREYI